MPAALQVLDTYEKAYSYANHIDGSAQDFGNSNALALGLLQFSAKSIYLKHWHYRNELVAIIRKMAIEFRCQTSEIALTLEFCIII